MQRFFPGYFSLLTVYFRPQWRRVLLLALLLIGSIALQLINPQIVRYVLDTARGGALATDLALAAALFTIFSLLQAGAGLAITFVGEDVSWTATNALRRDLAHYCLRLDMDFHNSHTPGELIARVDGDVSQLAEFFSQLVLRVLANGLLIAGVVVLLFREDWRMGAAAVAYTLLTVVALQAVQRRNVRNWRALRAAQATIDGFLEERLAGREDVLANGGEEYVLHGLARHQRSAYAAAYRARLFGVFVFALTHMLFVLATALGFGLGIYLFLNGQATIGTVYLIVYYLGVLRNPLEQIRDQVEKLQQSTASIGRIQELFALQPRVRDQSDLMAAVSSHTPAQAARQSKQAVRPAPDPTALEQPGPAQPLAVRFTNVSFGYVRHVGMDNSADQNDPGVTNGTTNGVTSAEERGQVLDDISFALAPGEILGLLGRTGSGKTTLTRLLLRLYEPDRGKIHLDDQDLRSLMLPTIRRQVGLVTQEVQLFQATLPRESHPLQPPCR